MADIPFLELARIGFQVKLEGEGVASVSERLIFIMRIERQSLSALRQVEAIAMPVQNRGICFLKGPQGMRMLRRRSAQPCPSRFP